jgi:hypothetical protein
MAIGLITYDDATRREDLSDFVSNVSPKETPLLSGLGKAGDATNTLHEYLLDTFASAAANAQVEAVAFTTTDHTMPSRLNNNCQIFADWVLISGTELAVNPAPGDPMKYQIMKNMVEHAKDIELALVAGSRASGSSGVARQLVGVINSISTNATARNSGASLGETTFNDIMEMIYQATDQVADEIYVGGTLKRDISGFTAGTTKNMDQEDRRLIRPVDVYESDFGLHKIFLHRNVPNGANAKALLAINSKYEKIAWLSGRRTKFERLSKDGDRERGQIVSELTSEHRAQAANAYVSGFTS